eukprot:209196-Hanusia_phi.AAC.2
MGSRCEKQEQEQELTGPGRERLRANTARKEEAMRKEGKGREEVLEMMTLFTDIFQWLPLGHVIENKVSDDEQEEEEEVT